MQEAEVDADEEDDDDPDYHPSFDITAILWADMFSQARGPRTSNCYLLTWAEGSSEFFWSKVVHGLSLSFL